MADNRDMFKLKTPKVAPVAVPVAVPVPVEPLPMLPALNAAEGAVMRTVDDEVHDAARAHAVALLASRDPLSSPDPKFKFSGERSLAGDAIAREMGLDHLVEAAVADTAACNGRSAAEWVEDVDTSEAAVVEPVTSEAEVAL